MFHHVFPYVFVMLHTVSLLSLVAILLKQETLCSMAFADRASRATLGAESAQEVRSMASTAVEGVAWCCNIGMCPNMRG